MPRWCRGEGSRDSDVSELEKENLGEGRGAEGVSLLGPDVTKKLGKCRDGERDHYDPDGTGAWWGRAETPGL